MSQREWEALLYLDTFQSLRQQIIYFSHTLAN